MTASDEAIVASTVTFGGPRGTVAIWRWTPSTSWVHASLSDTLLGALAWADGTFVGAESASMWTSTDGAEWTEREPPEGATDVCSLTASGDTGFLAFGRAADGIAAWTSLDGIAWARSEVEPAGVGGLGDQIAMPGPCSAVAAEDGLVAGVVVGDVTLIWTSSDGASWEVQESIDLAAGSVGPTGYRLPLAAGGRHIVLAGSRSDPAEPDGSRTVLLVGVVEP